MLSSTVWRRKRESRGLICYALSCTVFLYRRTVTIQTSYSQARATLAELLERVTEDREVVVIQRRGHEDVALVSASELSSLLETAHLLRSPVNARRLLNALQRAREGQGEVSSIESLRERFDLGPKPKSTIKAARPQRVQR
jgi:antitoxin YefM